MSVNIFFGVCSVKCGLFIFCSHLIAGNLLLNESLLRLSALCTKALLNASLYFLPSPNQQIKYRAQNWQKDNKDKPY